MLNSEIANLAAVDPNVVSVNDLKVSRQAGSTCSNDFSGVNATLLTPHSYGSANVVSWLTFNTPSFSNFYLHGGSVPLPQQLLAFEGVQTISGNNIRWEVVDEQSVETYTLELSGGNQKFDAVTEVKSGQLAKNKYSFLDTKPLTGTNNYRLRVSGTDGTVTLSEIVKLSNQSKDVQLQVLPYPTKVWSK